MVGSTPPQLPPNNLNAGSRLPGLGCQSPVRGLNGNRPGMLRVFDFAFAFAFECVALAPRVGTLPMCSYIGVSA